MWEYLSWFLIGTIFAFFYDIFYKKLTEKELEVSKYNLISYVFIGLLGNFLLSFNDKMLIVVLKYFIFIFSFKLIYKDSLNKVMITTFIIHIVYIISEIIFLLIFVVLLDYGNFLLGNEIIGQIITNILFISISLMIFSIKYFRNLFIQIIKWYNNKKKFNSVFFHFFGTITILYLLYQAFLNTNSLQNYVFIAFFLLMMIIFLLYYFNEKTTNNILTLKYDQLFEFVDKYGKLTESGLKKQHEYRNQLLLIKGMLPKNDKKILNYINDLLEINQDSEDYVFLGKMSNFPNEGLKRIMNYKIIDMIDNKINVYVEISDEIKNVRKIKKYLNNNLKDINTIICVYLDNAKEAAIDSDKKYIVIELEFNQDNFIFSVSNTYKGNIDINRINEQGYSKKGKNRGYGLSIVNEIIDKHNEINPQKEFNGIYYVQRVLFNYKK